MARFLRKHRQRNISKYIITMKKNSHNTPKQESSGSKHKEDTKNATPQENLENDKLTDTPTPDQELSEMKDKYLRLVAEFDNYKKRTAKEKLELITSGNASILNELLPVIDDLERALVVVHQAQDMNSVIEGTNLIYHKLSDFLKHKGLEEIDALNKPFDTDLHDAVTKFPVTEVEKKGTVIEVVQKGYMLNQKIIRYAKVVVGE